MPDYANPPFLCALLLLSLIFHVLAYPPSLQSYRNHLLSSRGSSCVPTTPSNTITTTLNQLLQSGGPGFVLNLCPNTQYLINDTIKFTAPNQEITTLGHPTDNSRATLVVNGPRTADGTGHTVAVNGQCVTCSGCKLHHIQVNGTRSGHSSILGGANIEMGGPTSGQVVEFVKSYDPRSWSCLHASEGAFNCSDITIQNNDIGPCGIDQYDQWADGVSVACPKSVVRSNLINTPTDGGIVIFGPEILVENNTIWVETHALSGGINLVDIFPWNNNFTGVVVQKNNIIGGFADDSQKSADSKGSNSKDAMIKVGIAMGPRVWFGTRGYGNVSYGAIVRDNRFTGGFGFAMAANGVRDFTVQDNTLVGNTAFFGVQGANCTNKAAKPITPMAFAQIPQNVTHSKLQSDFTSVQDADELICISPPNGKYWPYGSGEVPALPPVEPNGSSSSSKERRIGLGVGIPLGLLFVGAVTYLGRRWYLRRRDDQSLSGASNLTRW